MVYVLPKLVRTTVVSSERVDAVCCARAPARPVRCVTGVSSCQKATICSFLQLQIGRQRTAERDVWNSLTHRCTDVFWLRDPTRMTRLLWSCTLLATLLLATVAAIMTAPAERACASRGSRTFKTTWKPSRKATCLRLCVLVQRTARKVASAWRMSDSFACSRYALPSPLVRLLWSRSGRKSRPITLP